MHYDLQLALVGVLKSSLVTRGPSLDPTEEGLALRMEDYPVSYAEFEDTIGPCSYGAGTGML